MTPNKGKSTRVKGVDSAWTVNPPVLGEIAFDAMMMFDSQRRLTYWNRSAEQLYGWTSGEVLGKTADELFWYTGTPQEETAQKDLQTKVDTGTLVRGEYRACRKDGSFFFAECTIQAIFDEAGKISGYAAIHRDHTEQKRMEDEFALVAKLPEDNPNPVMRFSREGTIVYANPASTPLLEFWQQQGQTLPDHLKEAISKVFESKQKHTVEIEHNGITLFCTLAPAQNANHVNLYGNDISGRKKMEREIQSQMDEMNTLLDLLPVGVWVGNEDCSVITGNPAAYRIMGLEPGTNVSITNPEPQTPPGLRVFVEGQEVPPEDAPMQRVARTGKPLYNLEHEVLFNDGTRKTFLTNIVPLFDEKRRMRKVIGAYADITERKSNAERLLKLQQVTVALSEAVTPMDVARTIIEQGVPALDAATGSVFRLVEDRSVLENIYTSAQESFAHFYRRLPISLDTPAGQAIHLNTPVWIRSQQDYKDRYPNLVEQIEQWGLEGAVAIPLEVNDRTLGVLTLSFERVQQFFPEDQNFIRNLAQQGAQALERAQLYQKVRQALSELQATYDQTPIGMIQLDRELRYIRVNETLARMNGIPAQEHVGKKISEIVPDLAPQLEERLYKVIETGQPEYGIEIVGETKADPGVPHTWLEVWYPLRNENGDVMGVNIAVQDITERKRDDLALGEYARQQTAFYQLADQLHRTNTLSEVFDAALDAIISALQCDRGSILLFDEGGVMRFVAWRGLSDAYRKATDGHSPWKPDESNAKPIYYNDIRTSDLSETLKTIIQGEGIGALAFIPLVFEEKLIGKFMVYFNTPHIFSENDLDLSLTIAHQIAFGVQRKRAETALARERELLERLFETMPIMVSMYDAATQSMRLNAQFEQLIGWKSHEVTATFLLETLYPDPDYRNHVLQQMAAAGKNDWVEVRVQARDGHILDSLWSNVSITKDGELVTGIAIGIEISERKRAEEALHESQERFTQFMQHLPGLAWIKDVQGRYVYANDATEKAFNIPKEKLYGRTDEEIFPLETSSQFKKNDELALAENKGIQVIETLQQQDGLHYSLVSKFPIPDSNGTPVLIGGTAIDITERRQAEEALLESRKELQTLNETLEHKVQVQTAEIRQLASDLTRAEQRERSRVARILHDDLQQRLYAIQIQVASLADRYGKNEQQEQKDFERIRQQLQEAVLITRHLSIDMSPPILHDEGLTQAVEWLASQMKKQYGLLVKLEATESFATTDEDLRVLIYNCIRELLFNIIKHSGGNQAQVVLQRVQSDLRVEIRDKGKGFDVGNLPRQTLTTLDGSPRPQSFGLPTIHHQLNLFGGRMDIQSEPGKGTAVTIIIPYS